jgi:hypothetical protein
MRTSGLRLTAADATVDPVAEARRPRTRCAVPGSAKTTLQVSKLRGVVQVEQIVQVIGALLILTPFVLSQRRVLNGESLAYLVLNLAGSAALAVVAYLGSQWGFALLEGVWALVSAAGVRRWLSRWAGRAATSGGSD